MENATAFKYFLDKSNGAKFDFWAFHGYNPNDNIR
jgi:hypothetical protein